MSVINIPPDEKRAIQSIDREELDRLIDVAMSDMHASALSSLGLAQCGPYIAGEYRQFQDALLKHRLAKTSRKSEETGDAVRKSAYRLDHAVRLMQDRAAREDKDAELFYVYDDVYRPIYVNARMSVKVRYKWRGDRDSEWSHGVIEFLHEHKPIERYNPYPSKRKPSAALQRRERDAQLESSWESLKDGALQWVQEYFQKGRDGSKIPPAYNAKVDGYHGTLNNFSAKFWEDD